ncbi:MAG: UDP-N-acetylmuramate dehydrogenase [Candidatus Wildermuthbacteria bacterium]|nr:UDP-N-acetylmuramate dehydrogenase [Candidatus Wildermuthbacteria bacterium]
MDEKEQKMLELLPGVRANVVLGDYTTFRIGGYAKYFFAAKTNEDIAKAVRAAKSVGMPLFVLGGGSNILVSDKGFEGLVLKIETKGIETKESTAEEVEMSACAGENWDEFVSASVEQNLYGLENLSGIPGTVGAAPVQNIGAYGCEVKDTLSWAEVFNVETFEFSIKHAAECEFGYRESIFKKPEGERFIILRVAFILRKNGTPRTDYKDVGRYLKEHAISNPTLPQIRKAILEIRGGKFPDLRIMGTAGSFFKNPIISEERYKTLLTRFPELPSYKAAGNSFKIPLAWILDYVCKIKGIRKGNVGAFEKQPLVIVNFGGAVADEVKQFVEEIRYDVKEKTGIEVEYEVRFLGNF